MSEPRSRDVDGGGSSEGHSRRGMVPAWVRDLLIFVLVGLSGWTLHTTQELRVDVAVLGTALGAERELRGELKERVSRVEGRIQALEAWRGTGDGDR